MILKLFISFFKIGLFSYGGFMSMIAFSRKELVVKKQLVSEDDFNDGITFVSLLPGPTALNFCGYIGQLSYGTIGLIISVFAASLPALISLLILSYLYLDGFNPAQLQKAFIWVPYGIASIILATGINMFKKQRHPYKLLLVSLIVPLFLFSPIGTTFTLVALFVISIGYFLVSRKVSLSLKKVKIDYSIFILLLPIIILILLPLKNQPSSLLTDFLLISKYGLGLIGGGYVFIPLMIDFMVDSYNWLPLNVFYDGIAFGQITPGPIMISMFFFGFYRYGIAGGLVYFIAITALPLCIMKSLYPYFKSLVQNELLKDAFSLIRIVVIGAILFSGIDIISSNFSLSEMTLIGTSLTIILTTLQYFNKINVFHTIGFCLVLGIIFAG